MPFGESKGLAVGPDRLGASYDDAGVFYRHANDFGHTLGQQVGLVEAALPELADIEWHGHNGIYFGDQGALQQAFAHELAQ